MSWSGGKRSKSGVVYKPERQITQKIPMTLELMGQFNSFQNRYPQILSCDGRGCIYAPGPGSYVNIEDIEEFCRIYREAFK